MVGVCYKRSPIYSKTMEYMSMLFCQKTKSEFIVKKTMTEKLFSEKVGFNRTNEAITTSIYILLFSPDDIEIYRCHTSKLRCLDVLPKIYKSAKTLHLVKNSVGKVIYAPAAPIGTNLEEYLKTYQKNDYINVQKHSWKEKFSVNEEELTKKRKTGLDDDMTKKKFKPGVMDNLLGKTEIEEKEGTKPEYVLYGYNAHYGWHKIDTNTVHKSLEKLAVDNRDKICKVPGGAREQENNKLPEFVNDEEPLKAIKRDFRVSSQKDPLYGSCQWLAAAMLIHDENEEEAQKMIQLLHNDPGNFNWKMMYRKENNLSHTLSKNTSYRLMKVGVKQGSRNTNYIDFLLSKGDGKYVCLLQDTDYTETHVIGVDCTCNPKLILDCAERNALELNKENLDRCCGSGTACRSIRTIGEIVLKRKKKKHVSN